MEDPCTFWTAHPYVEAMNIARRHLADALRDNGSGIFKGHHVWRIGYSPDFDPAQVEHEIRRQLDEIDWLIVTTGQSIKYKGHILPTFGMAPILRRTLVVGYHATRGLPHPHNLPGGTPA